LKEGPFNPLQTCIDSDWCAEGSHDDAEYYSDPHSCPHVDYPDGCCSACRQFIGSLKEAWQRTEEDSEILVKCRNRVDEYKEFRKENCEGWFKDKDEPYHPATLCVDEGFCVENHGRNLRVKK